MSAKSLAMLLWLVACLLPLQPVCAQPSGVRTISVMGEGKVSAPPDMAMISTGVVTQDAAAADALAANSGAMKKLMSVLENNHVAAKDIQTVRFDVRPVYEQPRPGERPNPTPEIVAYQITNQLQVKVRNLPELGQVLDALVQAGSNQVSGISFGIDDPTGLLNQARNRAVADARARALLYAQALGVEVGPVISVSEQPPSLPGPQILGARMEAMAASVPIATGEQEVSSLVYVVFQLNDDQ